MVPLLITLMLSTACEEIKLEMEKMDAAETATIASTPTTIADIIDSKDLFDEFQNNAVVAIAKYEGQTFRVVGVINKIDYDYNKNPYIEFSREDFFSRSIGFLFTSVKCELSDTMQVANLPVGSKITVKGTFAEWLSYAVLLNPCSVSNP